MSRTQTKIILTVALAKKLHKQTRSVRRGAAAAGCSEEEFRRVLRMPDSRGRKPRPDDPAERQRLLDALAAYRTTRKAAEALGLPQTTFIRRTRPHILSKKQKAS